MADPNDKPSPWWRQPTMWLVVGGPLVVVVAGFVTAVIAIRDPDPVLRTQEVSESRSSAPAMQGRNHAATPAPASK